MRVADIHQRPGCERQSFFPSRLSECVAPIGCMRFSGDGFGRARNAYQRFG